MGQEGILRLFMSEDNLILKSDYLSQKHDMSQTFSHYYIHSSHNTYLVGELTFFPFLYIKNKNFCEEIHLQRYLISLRNIIVCVYRVSLKK